MAIDMPFAIMDQWDIDALKEYGEKVEAKLKKVEPEYWMVSSVWRTISYVHERDQKLVEQEVDRLSRKIARYEALTRAIERQVAYLERLGREAGLREAP